MNPFTLFTAPVSGNQKNTSYPNQVKITTKADLAEAVVFDHVAATYTNSSRSNTNFVVSDCVVMDVDNDHTNDPDAWVTPGALVRMLPTVGFMTASSRNNMRSKNGVTARPRFHVYFPTTPINDSKVYGLLKQRLAARFVFFDKSALDAGRFIYGTLSPEITSHHGQQMIDVWLDEADDKDLFTVFDASTLAIGEGSRNATLSRFAARVLVRYGNTIQARELFDRKACLCEPPLPDSELATIWASAARFATKIAADPAYVSPEVYDLLSGLRPEDFTDVGQATVLAAENVDTLAYSQATHWMAYNNGAWEENEPKAQRVVQEFTTRQLVQGQSELERATETASSLGVLAMLAVMSKAKALAAFTPDQARAYQAMAAAQEWVKFTYKCRNDRGIIATMRQARPLLLIDPAVLDANPYLLNTPSATYDLRIGLSSSRTPSPADMITKQTALNPTSEGMDVWLAALNVTFNSDQELIGYVQRICGLAAIGRVMIEALIIAFGDGNNGKSTFWNTIARVLGSYAETISAEVLVAGKKNNAKHDMAETRARRLLIAGENDEGVRLSTSSTKQLASTDKIAAEKKYKDPFSFTPSHTLVLYTNHLPKVGAMDTGIWRRLIVIPFDANIEPNTDIKNYAEHLYNQAGGAVLSWIMEGARLIHAEDYKLAIPTKVAEASQEYKEANDWFAHFIEECCEIGVGLSERSKPLQDAYRAWALNRGDYVRSVPDFHAALARAGFTKRRTKTARMIDGLKLTNEFII